MRPIRPSSSRGRRLLVRLTGAILCLALLGSCRGQLPGWNVVLISIDTLRPDHLGCYGYERPTSPNLDALCEESVVFRQAISHAPSTLPSHASLFSSLVPQHHGASFENRRPLADEIVTLPEVLRGYGYRNVSFNGGGQIADGWGVDQGFDVYRSLDEHSFGQVVDLGVDWLASEQAGRSPFLLFLHSFEVHHPYTPSAEDLRHFADPEALDATWFGRSIEIEELRRINQGAVELSDEELELLVSAYDAEIRSMDRALGRLLGALREGDHFDRTMIVFTSDHGEEFGEHGQYGWHAHSLYEELLRVPLVIKLPESRFAGERVARQVRLIDVAPTVLDALEAPIPDEFSGVSLLEILRGVPVPPLLAVSMRDTPDQVPRQQSIRAGRWKLSNGFLRDLRRDPSETLHFGLNRPDLLRELQRVLDEVAEGPKHTAEELELDPETEERLEALGYL